MNALKTTVICLIVALVAVSAGGIYVYYDAKKAAVESATAPETKKTKKVASVSAKFAEEDYSGAKDGEATVGNDITASAMVSMEGCTEAIKAGQSLTAKVLQRSSAPSVSLYQRIELHGGTCGVVYERGEAERKHLEGQAKILAIRAKYNALAPAKPAKIAPIDVRVKVDPVRSELTVRHEGVVHHAGTVAHAGTVTGTIGVNGKTTTVTKYVDPCGRVFHTTVE